MSVKSPTLKGDAICEFVLTRSALTSTLRVSVQTMSQPSQEYSAFIEQCDGVKMPLRAIGNEAIYCVAKAGNSEEKIMGRVRDRAFSISITTCCAGSSRKDGIRPSEEALNLAQQVAGALF